MSIALDQPWWMLLSLVGVVSAIIGWRWMSGIPRFRRICAMSLRVLLFVLLALILSGAYQVEEADDLAVIAVIDTSMSVQNFAGFGDDELGNRITIDRAARGFLSRASVGRESSDRLGVIAFDGRPQTIAPAAMSDVLDRAIDMYPVDGSDIPGALQAAGMQFPPDANARIVLFSDGRSTTAPLDQLAVDFPVDVVPIRYSVEQEVVVQSVELPARSLPESIVDVRVVVRSLGEAEGFIELVYNGEPVDLNGDEFGTGSRAQLVAGQRVLVYPVQLSDSRVHRFEAQFVPDRAESSQDGSGPAVYVGDTSLLNNRAGSVTMTSGQGQVLVLRSDDENGASQAQALVRVFQRAQWEIDELVPGAFPVDLLELEAYDLIVLVNTARDAIGLEADSLLKSYVQELGGGVIFIGGSNALGAGGWQGSEIEEILPINLDVADDLVMPTIGVVLVLDSSGSMRNKVMGSSKSQQAIANDSAAGAIEILDERDFVGVVSFSNSARRVISIAPNNQAETTRSKIASITSSGGTNIAPALNMAGEMLGSVDTNSKHIVLLSDGESQHANSLPEIAQKLSDQGVRVSTIAVGDDADEETMREIARISGGIYYRVRNPSVLPRVFLKAIRVVRTPMIREGIITPVRVELDTPATGRLDQLPPLTGMVMSETISDDPRVSTPIVSDKGEPIFAFHQAELGRVAVFTSDVSRWAKEWIDSDVFASFWTNASSWAMRSDANEPGELSLVVEGSAADIEYNAIDLDGTPIDGLDVQVQLFDDAGASRSIDLVQVGSGQYRGSADNLSSGVHVVIARPTQTEQSGGGFYTPTIAGLQIVENAEFKHLSADPQSLINLASRTGGRVFDLSDPDSANLFDRQGVRVRQSLEPIWMMLLLIAFVVFLLDLSSRRVAFDRWIAQARDETLAATRDVESKRVGQLKASRQSAQQQQPDTPDINRGAMPMMKKPPEKKMGSDRSPDAPESSVDDESNPLLAAKRRARERMDD